MITLNQAIEYAHREGLTDIEFYLKENREFRRFTNWMIERYERLERDIEGRGNEDADSCSGDNKLLQRA
jgi:hypothetical protein